jgi:glycosyltransferase involved in cell wall biosynthesis
VTAGFFAPLPPARSGVADYAAALLRELEKHGRVEIGPEVCDVALYHLGNNRLHGEIYRRAVERPGVVVLHDAVLHHFLLGQLGREAYTEEFVFNCGEWNRGLAAELWNRRAGSGVDPRYFEYPMLRRVAESALAVVVHNPAAAQAVRAHAPGARVVEIPHLFLPPPLPAGAEAIRYREGLGIPAAAYLFGVFGYLRESKRLMAVLEAFGRLRRENSGARLLVVGDFVSSDLERAAAPLLNAPGIMRLPYVDTREFWLAAVAVDACINLKYPSAGETSGIGIRLMGIGKPVLLTDSAEWGRIPEDACIRVPAGPAEAESLLEHMVLLTSFPAVGAELGRRGAAHIGAHHRLEEIGARFWKVLCDSRV